MKISDSPLISIIIPTYNRPVMLKRALNSLANQSLRNFEIVIVDDNSDIDYSLILSEFKDLNIIYIKNKCNYGGSASRNVGIHRSNGKFIGFLDDDDEFVEDKLEKQMNLFNFSKLKPDLVYTGKVHIDRFGKEIRQNETFARGNALKEHIIRPLTCTSTLLVKKEALLKIGGFRTLPNGQDYDLIMRSLQEGFIIDHVDEELVRYYEHDESRITSDNKKIDGELDNFRLRSSFFHLLDKKELKRVYYDHYLCMFHNHLVAGQRLNAFKYLFNLFKIKPLNNKLPIYLLKLLLGYPTVRKLQV